MPRLHRRTIVVIEKSASSVQCRLEKAPECSGCGGCAESTSLITLPADLLKNSTPSVGDSVRLEATGEILLALSLVVYLLPVLLMLLFSVGCSVLYSSSEAAVATAALVGLSLGLGVIYLLGHGWARVNLGSQIKVT